ncbi:MAG: bifunctional ADP-dependent NAD(P)H-hydrate dehydratase/NAD(P)H-hydrate epimerase [Bacteroidetes bacterium SW_11_45_7]|nr:MAG: bifunctional ADP-dependent NAD(P)H-hydrate dehydratase/NAD(P)H-hydrate epimerase [Bacteroidetes bacterium SW_11_45_7]
MKILTKDQVREADRYTIENEPIPSLDLMERAASRMTERIKKRFSPQRPVKVVCGTGNNGGDGLVIARELFHAGRHVDVYVIRYSDTSSPDFQHNEQRLQSLGVSIYNIHAAEEFPHLNEQDLVIEGLWGSGLNRPVEGFATDVIQQINESGATVVAIDIPSGLYADAKSDSIKIKADVTYSFQVPKLSFLLPDNAPYVGHWEVVDIGLSQEFIDQQTTDNELLTASDIATFFKPRETFDHKGTFGHVLTIAGSYGKMGAACLCAKSALRGGAGLVTAHVPQCGYNIIQTAIPEVMCSIDQNEHYVSGIDDLSPFDAIAIGPGLDTRDHTAKALQQIFQKADQPLVIDADGLNLLSSHQALWHELPSGSILTPHPGEFKRLIGKNAKDSYRELELIRSFAMENNVILVLKRAYTVIAAPNGKCYFNSTGNPAMATGGSGDVLTGLIGSLLAQGYSPLQSAQSGVFLHGLAGDKATDRMGQQALIAGDIISFLGAAYKDIGDS